MKYRLEITMEALEQPKYMGITEPSKTHIKRSFPLDRKEINLTGYGYPFDKYKTLKIGQMKGERSPFEFERMKPYVTVTLGDKEVDVFLHEFITIKDEEQRGGVDPSMRSPSKVWLETIHTTFYLYRSFKELEE